MRRERGRDLFGQLAEAAIGQRRTVRDDQRGLVGRPAIEQRADVGVDPSIVVDQRFAKERAVT
jgi:hypothetical protein